MTQFVFANNVNTELATAASSSATTLTLASSTNLPTLTSGQLMPLTLNDAATGLIYEIVYVTAISGVTLTVLRAQEGTGAQNWSIGDYAFCAPTAGTDAGATGNPNNVFQLAAGAAPNDGVNVTQAQTGALNYAVAGGTSDALTATLPAGVTALTDGFPLRLKLGAANTTTTPTLNVTIGTTATGAITIVKGADAALVAGDLPGAGAEAYFVYSDSLGKFVLMNPATGVTAATQVAQLQSLGAAFASNAMTVTYNGGTLDFPSATQNGTPALLTVASNSITAPSGASLGIPAGQSGQVVLLEANSGGTAVPCLVNIAGGVDLSETNLISPTTISSGATANNVIYSASAVAANSPYRVIGVVEVPAQTTAGVYATGTPTAFGTGGMAFSAMQSLGYGQSWKSITGSRALATTYYNVTSRPIMVSTTTSSSSLTAAVAILVNGISAAESAQASSGYTFLSVIVPPGASYILNQSGSSPALENWSELS